MNRPFLLAAVFVLSAGCTSDGPPDGEWPCRSTQDDSFDVSTQTYEYDANHHVTREVSAGGGFGFTSTSTWKGDVSTSHSFVGVDTSDYDSTSMAQVDDRDRVLHRSYVALGKNAGTSYEETYAYDGDRITSSESTYVDGRVKQITYLYSDRMLLERACTDGVCNVARVIGSDPSRPDRIEWDEKEDGQLDSWTDFKYDDWGYVTLDDSTFVIDGQQQKVTIDTTRRPYGAPEREVTSGQFTQITTYAFCSEDPAAP
jgi:hypothetical protein